MLRIFIGIDERQPIAYHVLVSSIQRRASKPVAITPLILDQLPMKRRGLTSFTYSRYLVPYLCGYEGTALFIDSDMLVLGDIAELFDCQSGSSVDVVPFAGNFAFERPSVMLFNCAECRDLTPELIETGAPQDFSWAKSVGNLSSDWNQLVGYAPYNPDAKLVHYTQGVPGYKECRKCDYAQEWFDEKEVMLSHCSWLEIMGNSVHAKPVLDRLKGDMQ
jgi:hypothetical protein